MKKIILVLMTVVAVTSVTAQSNYSVTNARYLTGTYTDISGSGTPIDMSNAESGSSTSPINIGFDFSFNGSIFTQCMIHSDGILRFGATAPGSHPALFTNNASTGSTVLTSTNANYQNVVLALFMDLVQGGAAPAYHVLTEGIAPNRVTTLQWKNLKDNNNSGVTNQNQFSNLEFQVKLYETSNDIRIIYGNFVPSSNDALNRNAQVGIKAGSTAFIAAKRASSLVPLSFAEFFDPAAHAIFNAGIPLRKTAVPAQGSGFIFYGQRTTDVNIAEAYVERTVTTSSSAAAHNRVRVKNQGTAALSDINVTMQITGANTFSQTINIATLGAGTDQVIDFSGYPIPNTGNQDVLFTATLPGDERIENNTILKAQTVSRSFVQALSDSANQVTGIGFNGTANNETTIKMFGTGVRKISQVRIPFNSYLSNVSLKILEDDGTGNSPGTILTTTAARNTNGDNETIYNLASPVTVNGDYYISVRQNNTVNMGWQIGIQYPVNPDRIYTGNGFSYAIQASDRAFHLLVKVVEESSLPDVGIIAITSPSCTYGTDIPVNLALRNYSSATHDFSVNPVTISGSVINDVTNTPIPFSIVKSSGTLAPGASENITALAAYDFSIRGSHRFSARTTMAGDAEPQNDSLFYLITNNIRLTKSYTDSICPFTTVNLTAIANLYTNVQWSVDGTFNTGSGDAFSFAPAQISVARVTATDYRGCTISDSLIIPVKANGLPPAPVITFSDTILSFRNGFSDTLTVSDLAGHSVNWQGSGITINGGLSYVVGGPMGQDPDSHLVYYRNTTTGCGSSPATITTRFAAGILMNNSTSEILCDTSFYDSGGSMYPNNGSDNFVKTFYPATPGSKVKLSFYTIVLGQFSTMRIYDGTSTSAPRLDQFDRFTPSTLHEYMASNNDGAITVSFAAGSSTAFGWLAGIKCEAPLQFRSVQNGAFTDAATWESKLPAAPAYSPAGRQPFKGDDAIIIRHAVTAPGGSSLPLDQTTVEATGTLSVPGASNLMLFSDNPGYEITVDGTLTINGNIYGSFGSSSGGKILLRGSLNLGGEISIDSLVAGPAISAATINATGSARVNRLVVNNPSGLTINGNLNISRILDLQNGVVSVTAPGFIRMVTGEYPALQGGSETSYINGKMRWQSFSTANALVFPVGKNGIYRKIELTANQTSSDDYVEYEAELFTGVPPARTLPATFTTINQQWYHNISLITGGSYFSDATVTIHYEAADGVTNPSELLAGKDDGGTNWIDIGGTATGSPAGSITSNSFSSFSDFILANLTGATLPVTLVSFNGKLNDHAVHLIWKVENEQHFSSYVVERSNDGGIFIQTGSVVASGLTNYQFTDVQLPASGVLYYRLKLLDQDGSFSYSSIIQVKMNGQPGNSIVTIAPNPFADRLVIQYQSAGSQRLQLQLLNIEGKVIKNANYKVSQGVNQLYFDSGTLPQGMYLMRVITGDKIFVEKVIKK